MATYLPRSWWRYGPPGMVDIDTKNPITAGLRRVFLPSCGLWDPARKAFWPSAGNLPFITDATRYGPAAHLHSGGTATFVSAPEPIPTAGWTIGMIFTPINGFVNKLMGFTEAPGNGTNDRCLVANAVAGGYNTTLFDGGTKNSGTTGLPDQFGTTSVIAGQCHIVVGRCTNDFVIQCWCNGHPGTTTACANNGFSTYASPEFCVGQPDNTTNVVDASYSLAFYANRAWTDEEILGFSVNPFQLFRARRQALVFAPTAAATPNNGWGLLLNTSRNRMVARQ